MHFILNTYNLKTRTTLVTVSHITSNYYIIGREMWQVVRNAQQEKGEDGGEYRRQRGNSFLETRWRSTTIILKNIHYVLPNGIYM